MIGTTSSCAGRGAAGRGPGTVDRSRRRATVDDNRTPTNAVLAALEPYFGPELAARGARFSDVVVRDARWDFAQLLEWQHVLVPIVRELVGRRGFATAITVYRNRVTFAVPDPGMLRLVEARFATLNLPCDLVHLEIGGRIRLRTGQPSPPASKRAGR